MLANPMPILITIWSFLKLYWKPLVIAGAIISIVLVIYLKGRQDMSRKIERQDVKESLKRDAEVHKVQDRATKVREKIRIYKTRAPHAENQTVDKLSTDELYSCLLSNDPITKDCL